MAPTKTSKIESSEGSVGQAGAGVIERAEERVSSIIQTMDSAAQTIQDTLRRTQNSASAAMGTVADGLETSTGYVTDRGVEGVVANVKALIRRYPFQAILLGCSVGLLISQSWKRGRTALCL